MSRARRQTKTAKKSAPQRNARGQATTAGVLDFGQRRWVALFTVVLLLCGYTGLAVVESAADARLLYQQLGEIQKEQDALLEENSRLSLERSSISSLQKVEEIAEIELDMEFPSELKGLNAQRLNAAAGARP